MNPYSDTTDYTTRLDYSDGSFYSINTIGESGYSNEVLYIAMGGSVIFSQDISNFYSLSQSCLENHKQIMYLRRPPVIKHIKDPLTFYSDDQVPVYLDGNAPYYLGVRTCSMILSKPIVGD